MIVDGQKCAQNCNNEGGKMAKKLKKNIIMMQEHQNIYKAVCILT